MSRPMRIPEGKIVLTYEDYVLLPNDRNRYEIIEGELSLTPAPAQSTKQRRKIFFILLVQHTRQFAKRSVS